MSVKALKDPEKLSYEEAMSELESLVGRMEQGGLTLEESVDSYARGIALTKACRAKLDRAEERIRKLDEEESFPRLRRRTSGLTARHGRSPLRPPHPPRPRMISATFLSDPMNAKENQMSEVSFMDWMKERQAHFESVAEVGIPGSDVFPQGLHEAMRWSILEGENASVRCFATRRPRLPARSLRQLTRQLCPLNVSIPIRSYMMIFPVWITIFCGTARHPPTRSSALPKRCLRVMRFRQRRSG